MMISVGVCIELRLHASRLKTPLEMHSLETFEKLNFSLSVKEVNPFCDCIYHLSYMAARLTFAGNHYTY